MYYPNVCGERITAMSNTLDFLLDSKFYPKILQYGISGPYWYAGGATIQIIIFSILSIMLKTRAPGAKTFLQVSKVLF